MTSGSQRGQPGIWRSNRPHSWRNKMLEKKTKIIMTKFPKLTLRLSWRRGCPTGGWRGRTGSRTGATAGAGRPGLHPYHDLQTSNMLYFMSDPSFNPVCLLFRIPSVCYTFQYLILFTTVWMPQKYINFFRTRWWHNINGPGHDHAALMWPWPLYEKWVQSVEIIFGVMWREEILRE